MNKSSFTSASQYPIKLLHNNPVRDGRIVPIHAQIIPTNQCNLNCKFCSYSDRDKSKSLSLEQVKWVIDILVQRRTESLTWTGGGEPILHNRFNDMLRYAGSKGLKSGLVTNGTVIDRLENQDLVWCRISSSDDRTPNYSGIEKALQVNPQTDFAFSHVITKNPNYQTINNLIEFSNKHKFTHVRLVSDLCDLVNVPNMDEIKSKINVDDSKVIYQGRKDSTKGSKNCYISLLKPVIDPTGIFPCCGTNYAIKGMERRPVEQMKMGEIEDLPKILDRQRHFDGSRCDICYYSGYNELLSKLKDTPKHLEFV